MCGADLAATSAAVCDPRGLAAHRYHRWNDYRADVSIGFSYTDELGYRLKLSCGGHRSVVWSQALPAKVRRRGAEVVRQWATQCVQAWMAGLDDEVHDTRAQAADAQQRALHARTAAAGADVSEPAELLAARAELASIDEQINDELGQVAA